MRNELGAIFAGVLLSWGALVLAAPGQIHYVKSKQAEIYEQPGGTSPPKLIIAVGRKVVEFDRRNEWVFVGIDKSGGIDGWVRLEQLGPTDPDGLTY